MIMNNVKETNVDNVIPFRKPKSGLHEPVINETLIRLNDYLKRINKYSVRELESGNYGLEDFNDFEIGEPKLKGCHYKCWFSYDSVSKMCEFVSIPIMDLLQRNENPRGQKLQFRKNAIRDDFRRKKLSIWIASIVFSNGGAEVSSTSSIAEVEEELDDIFRRGVFGDEHNFILYD
ncbi:uncharacterized protein METZ01_LOCUS350647 [marine metagenome]|uniref:Uncharacterized protein n=1 Tax=marine metagenome TaxID=408172 RepID=A0A382RJB6_9ZZZZ